MVECIGYIGGIGFLLGLFVMAALSWGGYIEEVRPKNAVDDPSADG